MHLLKLIFGQRKPFSLLKKNNILSSYGGILPNGILNACISRLPGVTLLKFVEENHPLMPNFIQWFFSAIGECKVRYLEL